MFIIEIDIFIESFYRYKDNNDNGNNDKDFCIELYIDILFDYCI